jgi:4'-phosphopantetheinyl transferase
MPPDPSRPAPGQVRVWHALASDVLADDHARERALTFLGPAELARARRYRVDADRDMFLVGRVMARLLVGRALDVPPTAWSWHEGPRGRPGIAEPETPLHFNLAHSAGLVVCALAPASEVGVDVEDLRRPSVERGMVRRYCSPAEIADIDAQGAAWSDRFLVYWTLKEAYLKARGLGIALPLASISFSIDGDAPSVAFLGRLAGLETRWAFDLVRVTDRHLVATAAPMLDRRPTFVIERLSAPW